MVAQRKSKCSALCTLATHVLPATACTREVVWQQKLTFDRNRGTHGAHSLGGGWEEHAHVYKKSLFGLNLEKYCAAFDDTKYCSRRSSLHQLYAAERSMRGVLDGKRDLSFAK